MWNINSVMVWPNNYRRSIYFCSRKIFDYRLLPLRSIFNLDFIITSLRETRDRVPIPTSNEAKTALTNLGSEKMIDRVPLQSLFIPPLGVAPLNRSYRGPRNAKNTVALRPPLPTRGSTKSSVTYRPRVFTSPVIWLAFTPAGYRAFFGDSRKESSRKEATVGPNERDA